MKKKLMTLLLSLALVVTMMPAMTMTAEANASYATINNTVTSKSPVAKGIISDTTGEFTVAYSTANKDGWWMNLPSRDVKTPGSLVITSKNKLITKIELTVSTVVTNRPIESYFFLINGRPLESGFRELSANDTVSIFLLDQLYERNKEIRINVNTDYARWLQEGSMATISSVKIYYLPETESANWTTLERAMKGEEPMDATTEVTVQDENQVDLFKVKDETLNGISSRKITLLSDIEAGTMNLPLQVPENKKIILDLNGHVLDRGFCSSTGPYVMSDRGNAIRVCKNGSLEIQDSNQDNIKHKFKVIEKGAAAGLWVLDTNGDKEIEGGVITGACCFDGGAIYVDYGADPVDDSIIINGGNVIGNYSLAGAGIFCCGLRSIMNGGNITGNFAERTAGGVFILNDNLPLVMTGGTISYNVCMGYGGGIGFNGSNDNLFVMTGGKIVYNKAGSGGAIYDMGKVYVGGTSIIENNTNFNGDKDDLYHGQTISSSPVPGKIFMGDGTDMGAIVQEDFNIPKLTEGSRIYVRSTINKAIENASIEGLQYFYSDISGQYFSFNDNGTQETEDDFLEPKLIDGKKKINIDSSIIGGSVYVNPYAAEGEEVAIKAMADSGYEFEALTVTDEDGTSVAVEEGKFTMPEKAVTVLATFKKIVKPIPVPISYKVKFNLQDAGLELEEITVDEDGKIVKPEDPAREGYTFGGWFKDEACTQAWDFDNDTVSEDTMLYAKWIKNTPKKTKVVLLKAAASGKKAIKLSWNKVSGATKYVIYAAKCDTKLKKIATVKGNKYTFKKLKGKKLKAHKTYKFYVVAYTANGKVKSRTLHFITGNTNGKYANVKSIKAKYDELLLSVGVTQKVKATYKMYKGKKHIKDVHGKALKYKSNCPGVATVTKNGVVKAVGQGTATIYIQDISGKYCKVKVTVE